MLVRHLKRGSPGCNRRLIHQTTVQIQGLKMQGNCSEGFPGLRLHTDECQRCSRDKHIPKLYSSTNNMDPDPVPPQLQVSLRSSLL